MNGAAGPAGKRHAGWRWSRRRRGMALGLVVMVLLLALAPKVAPIGAGPAFLADIWALCYAPDDETTGACGLRTETVPAA